MLAVIVFYSGVLMPCWTGLCVTLEVPHRQQLVPAQDRTVTVPHYPPCLVDDVFTVLHEDVGNDGELPNSNLTLFGICTISDNSSGSVLLELAQQIRRNQRNGLDVLHPAAVFVSEDDEQGMLMLTFDLPQSPLLKLNPVLLLLLESPLAGRDLDITFASQSLQPDKQSVCISGETHYILLTGKSSEETVQQKWRITVETKSPDMKQNLKDILIGGKSGSNISMTPLLLFSGGTGTDTRHTQASGPSPASVQTSFLCELKRFLGAITPQELPESPLVQLDSLQSLPPLTLGLSSSEALLAGMINSTAPTIFSFTSWGSTFPVRHGELALSPALLEELQQRLEEAVTLIMDTIREEKVAHRAVERLVRLRELSALQRNKPASGERQYCAFLLLKALQTMAHAYDMQRRLRATRAHPGNPVTDHVCGLKSLSVSLEKVLVGPNTANINNCHGSCAFPLTNANNHAIQLHFHIENGNMGERAPCCVPVAYEGLDVMELNEHGTYISTKPDVIAKECGCR